MSINSVEDIWAAVCEECKINTFIDGFDIISSIKENFNALFEQYSKKTTDNFNAYYKQK